MRKTRKALTLLATMSLVASSMAGCAKNSSSDQTTAASTEKQTEATTGVEDSTTSDDTTAEDTTADETTVDDTTATDETTVEDTEESSEEPAEDQFINLALHVYYNDGDHDYYTFEYGDVITVQKEGQYTVSFDCDKDLSDDAKDAGVTSLTNLTAIYITAVDESILKACDIMYDSVIVNDEELTITLEEPKSAFKSNGIFDTNDPINAWEGSCVEGVSATSEHVANFDDIEDPKTISVTFTLSNMDWVGQVETEPEDPEGPSGDAYVNKAVYSDIDLSEYTALELTKIMGNGINLGNTMEAVVGTIGKDAAATVYEQGWGQPITTEAMIKGMKNCGFDTLRIPVAWANTMDYENGDLEINEDYLDRVEEIVNYALDNEMFVIVNDHWDGGWWDLFGKSNADVELAWDIYEAIWTQVGERFKGYPDMLILESANEELGKPLNVYGSMSDDETYELMNAINQKFVEIIRGQGGNNANRFLLIAGDNTNIDRTCDDRFKMPEDTAESKLIVSVHYYDPWNYCGDKSNFTVEKAEAMKWGLKEEYDYMANQVAKMDKFTEAGYGVIIGEWGALPAYVDGKVVAIGCTDEYTQYFLDVCDIHNFCPVLWSTGTFDKKALTMITPSLVEDFTVRCFAEESALGGDYLTLVEANMALLYEEAPEHWEGQEVYEPGTPVSWIMWNGGAGTYSVGNEFNSADCTAGITATNVVVDGAGEYTVRLDFAGPSDGLTFGALAIADADILYPGCIIDIKEILVNDEAIELAAKPYTSSDDGKCTRVNLINEWVSNLPEDARTADGDLTGASPVILDKGDLIGVSSIEITYELIIPEE